MFCAFPSEADTGANKAHNFSWDKGTREGPLAHTMGFMASSPGKGRMEPYLQEQHELQVEMQAKRDAVAGSPSPQLDSTGGASSNSDAPVLPRPKGSVAAEMRSRSPNKLRQSAWWQQHGQQQQQQANPWRQPSSSPSRWWSSTWWQQPSSSSWWQSDWSTWWQQ